MSILYNIWINICIILLLNERRYSMKRINKLILPLILALVIAVSSSSSIAYADPTNIYVSAPNGGTWVETSFSVPANESLVEIPRQSLYLTYAQVKVLYDASIQTNSFWSLVKEQGLQAAITYALAQTVKKKFALDLGPLVGVGFVICDLYNAAMNDAFNAAVKKAYYAGTGLQIDSYTQIEPPCANYAKFTLWSSGLIFYQHKLQYNNGYANGSISLGTFQPIYANIYVMP